MSWELMAMPFSAASQPDLWDAVASFTIARLPSAPSTDLRPMTVADLVDGLRSAQVAGAVHFAVTDLDLSGMLRVPEPQQSGAAWGIGMVSVHVEGKSLQDTLEPADPITLISFDKPHSGSVLTAACALADRHPLVVFDADLTGIFVATGDAVGDIASAWPWP